MTVGFITETEKDMIVQDATLSDCCKKCDYVSPEQKELHLKEKETWTARYKKV